MRSRESVAEGERVTVERNLFNMRRSHCYEVGIREGARLDGRSGTPPG